MEQGKHVPSNQGKVTPLPSVFYTEDGNIDTRLLSDVLRNTWEGSRRSAGPGLTFGNYTKQLCEALSIRHTIDPDDRIERIARQLPRPQFRSLWYRRRPSDNFFGQV